MEFSSSLNCILFSGNEDASDATFRGLLSGQSLGELLAELLSELLVEELVVLSEPELSLTEFTGSASCSAGSFPATKILC